METLSKPADEIALSDIESLIDSRMPESDRVEYKRSLPATKRADDPWMAGEGRIGDRARNEILEETVAFANAYGGVCLLGIRESDDKPAVAEEILPIPRVAELVERLKMVFRDCVDPQLPRIEIFAVPTDEDQRGVVVIRIGKSRLAPHRVKTTLVCPIRRQDRCEKMTMREIQDMTLNLFRGTERLERKLSDRSERFTREFKRLKTPDDAWGLRLTAAPVGEEIHIDRVIRDRSLHPEFAVSWRSVIFRSAENGRKQNSLRESRLIPIFWRPMLRAARAELRYDSYDSDLFVNCYREFHDDGLVEFGLVSVGKYDSGGASRPCPLDPDFPVELFANLIVWANHVRTQAHAPAVEYVIEVQFDSRGGRTIIGKGDPRYFRPNPCNVSAGSHPFPRYSLGNPNEIPELLKLFYRDFWNLAGEDFDDDGYSFEILDSG